MKFDVEPMNEPNIRLEHYAGSAALHRRGSGGAFDSEDEMKKRRLILAAALTILFSILLAAGYVGWLFLQRETYPPAERPNQAGLEQAIIRLAAEIEADDDAPSEDNVEERDEGESNQLLHRTQ